MMIKVIFIYLFSLILLLVVVVVVVAVIVVWSTNIPTCIYLMLFVFYPATVQKVILYILQKKIWGTHNTQKCCNQSAQP